MHQGNRALERPALDVRSLTNSEQRRDDASLGSSHGQRDYRGLAAAAAIFAIALVIGCVGVERSGTFWPDGPQYANAGAMIRDWIRSGQLLHPVAFANANYAQYPAFSIPYHPPGYPALLGAFFLLTGVTYESARLFVALLLGVAGCGFYAILRRFTVERGPAFACTLLLLTLPEIAMWSRDTMSEIPALAFMLVASYGFLRWLETERLRDVILAFGFAGLAFFSKVSVIGVLIAWPIWMVVRGQWRRMLSPALLVPAALFVAVVAAWTRFFIPYARYETQIGLSPDELAAAQSVGANPLQDAALSLYLRALPPMTGWSILVASLVGLGVAMRLPEGRRAGAMWLAWFAGYLAFLLIIPLHYEARYMTFALPALPALLALPFLVRSRSRVAGWIGYGLVAIVLVENLARLPRQPIGVVGYDQVARRLAALDEPGNVLVSVPVQNDLIFRYRSASPHSKRQFIRSDRTITLRLPAYAPIANRSRVLLSAPEDFMDLIRRGRVRYVVTVPPSHSRTVNGQPADEMVIAARNVAALSADFAPVDSFRVGLGNIGPERDIWVHLWAYRHPLPDGPSEIPVTIPTAGITIRRGG